MLPLPRRFLAVLFALVLLAGCGRAAPADLAPLRSNATKLAEQFRIAYKYRLTPNSDWAGVTLALLVDTQTIAEELAKQSPAQKEVFLKLADACELFADAILENNATKMDAGSILFLEAAKEFGEVTGESLFEPTATPTLTSTRLPTLTPRPPTPLPGPPEAMVDSKLLAEPKLTAPVSGTVAAGDLLDLVMVTADGLWYQTAAGGWIHAGNVANRPTGLPVLALQRLMRTPTPTFTATPIPMETPTPTPTQASGPNVATARGPANLRQRPRNDAKIMGTVPKGQAIEIAGLSSDGEWAFTIDGYWILSDVLRDIPEGLPEVDINLLTEP